MSARYPPRAPRVNERWSIAIADVVLLPALRTPFFQPLSDPPLRSLLVGGSISAYGDALQTAALAWTVVAMTHSPRGVGWFALAWLLPRAGASLVSGVVDDRYRRSTVLKLSVAATGLISLLLFACAASGVLSFGVLIVLSLSLSIAMPFEVGARNTLFSSIVPREQLAPVITLSFVLMYCAELLGLLTGGLIIGSFGIAGCIAVNLVTYAVYAVLLRSLRSEPIVASEPSFGSAFIVGARFVGTRRNALIPLCISALFALLGFHFDRTLLPLYAIEELHSAARTYGVMLAAPALGAVLGLSFTRGIAPERLRSRLFLTMLLLAACLALLALCTSQPLALLLFFAIGAARGIHYSTIATMLQLKVPEALRGRIFSFYTVATGIFGLGGAMLTWIAPLLGARLDWHLGFVPDLHGLRAAMLCAAVAVVVGAVACVRPLRRIGPSGVD